MDTRDQKKNEELAWMRLEEKLRKIEEDKFNKDVYKFRFNQIGYSERSDKKRTYRLKENLVVDHETGKTTTFTNICKGKIELLS